MQQAKTKMGVESGLPLQTCFSNLRERERAKMHGVTVNSLITSIHKKQITLGFLIKMTFFSFYQLFVLRILQNRKICTSQKFKIHYSIFSTKICFLSRSPMFQKCQGVFCMSGNVALKNYILKNTESF